MKPRASFFPNTLYLPYNWTLLCKDNLFQKLGPGSRNFAIADFSRNVSIGVSFRVSVPFLRKCFVAVEVTNSEPVVLHRWLTPPPGPSPVRSLVVRTDWE